MSETTSSIPHARPEDAPPKLSTVAIVLAAIVAFAIWQPQNAKTIAIFLVTLGILVFVHEWGHYQFARWGGMKVNRFGIGFPPWIYTKRHNGIDYSIGALPIGGMVDIAGLGSEEEMVATAKDGTATGVKQATEGQAAIDENTQKSAPETRDLSGPPSARFTTQMSTFAAYANRNPDAPHGQKQFQDASLAWRFWALFAGPLMNFLFALVVYVGMFTIVGLPKIEITPRVDAVQSGMPAEKAGIQSGDVIKGINGEAVKTTEEIAKKIRAASGQTVQVTLQRGTQTVQKSMTPQMDEIDEWDPKTETTKTVKVPLIGVEFTQAITGNERVGVGTAIVAGGLQAYGVTEQIFSLLGRVFTGNLSKSDKRGVGGPVKIAQTVGRSADLGWQHAMLFLGGLSVNLGLMNLLPFPALDGGRILFLAYELVMRRPFDPRKEGVVHMVGMVMLLAFMLFITVRDVVPFFAGRG